MQNFGNLRSSLFTVDELSSLSKKNVFIPILDILLNWILIIFIFFLIYKNENLYINIFLYAFLGSRIYSLYILGHDGMHGNFSKNAKINNIITDYFILGFFLSKTDNNKNHLEHHKFTSQKQDPERHKYLKYNKDTVVNFFLYFISIKTFLLSLKNIKLKNIKKDDQFISKKKFISFNILVCQFFVICILTKFFGPFGYLIFWIIPVLVFAYIADLLRVFCEHSDMGDDNSADRNYRLISFNPNFFEKLFLSPLNMNFHAVHHLFPQIPYYNLEKANEIIEKRKDYNHAKVIQTRDSYFNYIYSYIAKLLSNEKFS